MENGIEFRNNNDREFNAITDKLLEIISTISDEEKQKFTDQLNRFDSNPSIDEQCRVIAMSKLSQKEVEFLSSCKLSQWYSVGLHDIHRTIGLLKMYRKSDTPAKGGGLMNGVASKAILVHLPLVN